MVGGVENGRCFAVDLTVGPEQGYQLRLGAGLQFFWSSAFVESEWLIKHQHVVVDLIAQLGRKLQERKDLRTYQ